MAVCSQVVVKDHLDKPVKNVEVGLVRRELFRQGQEREEMPCSSRSTSSSSGIAIFICNVPKEAARAALTVSRTPALRGAVRLVSPPPSSSRQPTRCCRQPARPAWTWRPCPTAPPTSATCTSTRPSPATGWPWAALLT